MMPTITGWYVGPALVAGPQKPHKEPQEDFTPREIFLHNQCGFRDRSGLPVSGFSFQRFCFSLCSLRELL
jgi:hypothetical protein